MRMISAELRLRREVFESIHRHFLDVFRTLHSNRLLPVSVAIARQTNWFALMEIHGVVVVGFCPHRECGGGQRQS
jgi:hypothetical protein